MTETAPSCRYCGSRLKKWRLPEGTTWSEEFFYVCFNDECSYYKDGWNWMRQQFNQEASFRYAVSPANGASLQIPVWSSTATREMIVEDDEGVNP
jgi:hypothetical protein